MTMKMSQPNFVRSAALIARGVWIESLRQKDILALVVLMGLYFLSVFVIKLVGIDNPATGSFLYNLGLTLTCYVAHAMALLSAGRQVPDEIENRTIYPILAKPITRSAFIAGKWFAATSFGWVSGLALLTLVYIFTPQMEPYSALLGFQALTLMSLSLGALSAWAILLSMVAPKPVVYLLLGGWFVVGDKILTIIQSALDGWSGAVIGNRLGNCFVTGCFVYRYGLVRIGFPFSQEASLTSFEVAGILIFVKS